MNMYNQFTLGRQAQQKTPTQPCKAESCATLEPKSESKREDEAQLKTLETTQLFGLKSKDFLKKLSFPVFD